MTVVNVSLTVSYSLTSAPAQSSSAVASRCISSGNLSSLAEEGQSVSSHVLKMKGYIDNMERLSKLVGQNLAVSLILVSLNKDFDSFMQNYNMHGMGKTVNELHAMLKLHEETLPKKDANPALHAIRGLRGSKKLKPGALSHYVGHGHRTIIEAIRTYHLELPSGLVIVLNNCHYTRVSKNNLVYFMDVLRDGIFKVDMSCSNTNDNSMYFKGSRNQLEKTIKSLRSDRGDALLDPESKKWLDAMNVEMQSMKDNDVRVLDKLPPNARTVGSKWLFKKKSDIDEVYMEQPEGFVNLKYPNQVCKLKHSIYGLKQASRQWNKRFDDEIKKFGFTQNSDEPCVYLKASGSYIAMLILYVDDILLMGNNIPKLQEVKSYFGRSFAIKDLGDAAYILGIKIYRDRSKRLIGLCQSAYIEKILKRYYMENSKRRTIPMQEKLKLSKSQGASTPAEKQSMKNIPYTSAIGSIMYVVRCTRPDVAITQNMTRRFQQNLGEKHWTAVKNILKYLRNTKDMFLVYGDNIERELRVSCYTDAGYLTNVDNLKSPTGYMFILNRGVIE
uniref:Retrotransposon protein, putative, Ty1-copia subclass n=1 Tax=Tanacetum cinerariifolium TaxID=118510 RepID=A0A699GNW0_TANCI|nr:retrotransposon protein, putative, Ty1-copia subclass [Tanacetum cinerariifolium]